MQHHQEIHWQVDPTKLGDRPRIAQHKDEGRVSSPRFLTINIPAMTATKRKDRKAGPPIEIIIGGDPKKKLPKTIEVKESFRPPPAVVVVKKESAFVPDVIQIQEMAPPTRIPENNGKAVTPQLSREEDSNNSQTADLPQDISMERSPTRPTDPFVEACEAKKTPVLQYGVTPLRKRTVPLDDNITKKEADDGKGESAATKNTETTNPPTTTTRGRGQAATKRTSSPDPPAAKADTTCNKILPDFTQMAKQTIERRHTAHFRNSFSEGQQLQSNLTQQQEQLHHSWPTTVKHSSAMNIYHHSRHDRRVPFWLEVTGKPEDWIQATSPDNIEKIGRKIAEQRLHEM